MLTKAHDGRTLQKSIDLTPLLPSAGPTGGEGDAWPAPTISFTIWSFCATLRAMVGSAKTAFVKWCSSGTAKVLRYLSTILRPRLQRRSNGMQRAV